MTGLLPGKSWNFYPRPPRGGRQFANIGEQPVKKISIHALREEGDSSRSSSPGWMHISIHVLREEGDGGGRLSDLPAGISIHALREEGDAAAAPVGLLSAVFLSTPSARRATEAGPPW